jgi:tetratricopeptide (TPR) repeat protein
MALSDCRGVPVSTGNGSSLDHFEKSLELLNGYFVDPLEEIDTALAADPGFIMGHCIRGGMHAVASEKAAEPGLRESVEAAEALAGNANDRERGHIAALRAWLDGDFRAATDGWGAVAVDYPRDLLALQLAHLGDFYLGRSSMLRDRIGRALPHWDESVPGFGYVLGMRAFGLEEMNEFDRAEETGRRAVELNPRDPWAIHAVAHVLEMTGKLDVGVDWMTERTDDWATDNMFAFHNWWHLALYHLDRGETARVLEIYDTGVRPEASDVALEMLDASSLLWRLHLDGIDVGGRWAELADMWEGTMADGYYAFNDVHAMMAFVGDGREASAKTILATMEKRLDGGGTNAMMTAEVGLPVARAIQAFVRGDYATAVDFILPVAEIAHRFGGSNAQRDVIHRTLVEAAIRAGQGNLARALVAERLSQKPDSLFNKTNMKRAEALAA